jgi:hypothetical protein
MTKIKTLQLQDFAGMDEVTVNFSDNVTYLVGNNGSGKSTIGINGIQFVLQGIAERAAVKTQNPIIGERFRFIKGDATSAKGAVLLTDTQFGCDIVVKRKVTATSTELSFEAPTGIKLDQPWLNDLYSSFCMSPTQFCSLSGQEQAKFLGIDLSEEEAEIKQLKEDFTYVNRKIKDFGTPTPVQPCETVDEKDLLDKIARGNAYNNEQIQLKNRRDAVGQQIEEYKRKLKELEDALSKLPEPKPVYDISKLENALAKAIDTNKQANAYKSYKEAMGQIESLTKQRDENKDKQKKAEEKRIAKLQKAELPIKGLSVSETGELMLNDKLIRSPYFSSGELIMISSTLIATTNPELKYIYIQDFNLLDEANQAKLIKYLSDRNFQIVAEFVGEGVEGENVIKLQSNKVINQ